MTDSTPVLLEHRGASLKGQLFVPQGNSPHSAVMVMHSAQGLGPVALNAARDLAARGYVALAIDMFGDGIYHGGDTQAIGVSVTPLHSDPELLRTRVVAWFEMLKSRREVDPQRIAAIGYCFGGQCVLELARSGADVKLVVSYHGLLTTHRPAEPGTVKSHVVIYTGALDPYAPHDHVNGLREEMITAQARWQITEFGNTCHAFTDPDAAIVPVPGVAYDLLARNLSWTGTLALLQAFC